MYLFLLRQQFVTTAKTPRFASVYEGVCVFSLQNRCVLYEHSDSTFQIIAIVLCDDYVNSALF